MQLKTGLDAAPAELLKWVAARTPERAAVPTQLYVIDSIPLTAVGKVFKPALRTDAAERAVRRLLGFLREDGCTADVRVGAHDKHGTVITVQLEGSPAAGIEEITRKVRAKLDPLPLRNEIKWRKTVEEVLA